MLSRCASSGTLSGVPAGSWLPRIARLSRWYARSASRSPGSRACSSPKSATAISRSRELRYLARRQPLLEHIPAEVRPDEHHATVPVLVSPRLDGVDLEQLVHALQGDLPALAGDGDDPLPA